MIIDIPKPYLLFLGDVEDELLAKTAFGIRDWCRAECVGQHRVAGSDMQHVGAAIFFAKSGVRAAHVENDGRLTCQGIGKL